MSMSKTAIIKLPCGRETLVDADKLDFLNQYTWWASPTNYVSTSIGGRKDRKNFYMHRMLIGARPGYQVDHLNKNKLDNRISNLKECERWQNCHGNNIKTKKSLSQYVGVTKIKRPLKKPWTAHMGCKGFVFNLGYYETERTAALAYDLAALKIYGIHAKLNILKYPLKIPNKYKDIKIRIPEKVLKGVCNGQ